MKTKTLRFLSLFILVTAFSRTVYAQTSKFMSADEVRPGMKGIGRTVFQGTKIDEFDVELLGVLKNFAPKQDMILARLSGGPLSHTGVIAGMRDRKSTRLNSSHDQISYAVFCLKKKKKNIK